MKKIFCFSLLICLCYFSASAQCEKKYKLKTERVFQVNPDGSEGEDVPFQADITFSKDSIFLSIILPDGNAMELIGKHRETVCKMNADYSEGTIEWKTDAEMNRSGETRQEKMLFTVQCKEGKMKVYGEPESQQGEKICFQIKEKTEVK